MHLETQLTEADFISAAMIYNRRRPGGWFLLYVLPFLCLALALPLAAMSWYSHRVALELLPAAIALCIPLYNLAFGHRLRFVRVFRDKINLQCRNFVDIDDIGIHSRDVAEDKFFAWSDFAAYAEGKTVFVGFLDSQRKFYMLAKRDLTSAQLAEVRTCFQTHVSLRRPGPTRKAFLRGCTAAAFGFLVVWFTVPSLFWYYEVGYVAKHNQISASIPKPLPDISVTPLDTERFSAFGCTVQAPFAPKAARPILHPASATEGANPQDRYAETAFGEQFGLMVVNPKYEDYRLREIRKATGTFAESLRAAIGAETLASPFKFARAALYAQASDARLFTTGAHNRRIFQFLFVKPDIVPLRTPGAPVYELSFGDTRGFQFGDPAKQPFRLILDLYDPHDRHLRIHVFARPRSNATLTQPQINALVSSLRCP